MVKVRQFATRLALLASILLCGCSSGMKAGILTIKSEVTSDLADVRKTSLNPNFQYLLVETSGQEALLVWVGNEPHQLGEAQVWVSADGVIIRTVSGRLVAVSEPNRHWQLVYEKVTSPLLPGTTARCSQITDMQPGYLMGVERAIDQKILPPDQQPKTWFDQKTQLQWLQEIDPMTQERLAISGFDKNNYIVAGQRCITAKWCLRWQSWPAPLTTSSP